MGQGRFPDSETAISWNFFCFTQCFRCASTLADGSFKCCITAAYFSGFSTLDVCDAVILSASASMDNFHRSVIVCTFNKMYICISTNNKRVAAHDTQTLSTRIVYMNSVHKHLDRQPIREGVQSRDGCAISRSRNGPRAISRWTES